jgi:hypothetical protein
MSCVAVIAAKDRASMQSHKHEGSRMLGTVRKISVLRGFYVWETPTEDIKRAIASLDETWPKANSILNSKPSRPKESFHAHVS